MRDGFGVLVFDWPGHGESGGSVHYGAPERDALYAGDAWRSSLDLLARSAAAPKLKLTAGNA